MKFYLDIFGSDFDTRDKEHLPTTHETLSLTQLSLSHLSGFGYLSLFSANFSI